MTPASKAKASRQQASNQPPFLPFHSPFPSLSLHPAREVPASRALFCFGKSAFAVLPRIARPHWSLRSRPFGRVRKQSFGLLRRSPHMSLNADSHKGARPLDPFGGRLTSKALGTVKENTLYLHNKSSPSEGAAKGCRGRPQSPLENLTLETSFKGMHPKRCRGRPQSPLQINNSKLFQVERSLAYLLLC